MNKKSIRFVDMNTKYRPFVEQFHRDLDRVLESGYFILGEEVTRLEQNIGRFANADHSVAVGNCTDALILSLKAAGVGPGDEVITSPMSYLATTSTIALCGATAVFIDVDGTLNLDPERIESAITDRTRAISVVHLAGIPARIDSIVEIADRHGLAVIEDCAQSFGAALNGKSTGTFGRFGTVSFHPLKNLGTLGDGGLILTQRASDAAWLKQARNHGHSSRDESDFWTVNSRLDELHAAFLSTILEQYPRELLRRRNLAEIYRAELAELVFFPEIVPTAQPSYNWIMILTDRRADLMEFLTQRGVETKIHYPILIPDMKAATQNCRLHGRIDNARKLVQQILSLPTGEHITEEDAFYVCDQIKAFFTARSGKASVVGA